MQNCFIDAALAPEGEWLQMMSAQLRQWAEDFINEDRERCACMLDTAGEFEAAKLMRGFKSVDSGLGKKVSRRSKKAA